MNMNILVPSLERTGYFRDQKPVTCALAHKPSTISLASPSPPAQGKGHLCTHGRTFWYRPLSSPQPLLSCLELKCSCAIPGAGHGWAGLPQVPSVPRQPAVPVAPLPQGWTTPLTSATRSCHPEEQETGTRNQYCPPRDVPKPRHVLMTYGGFFSTVKKSMVVPVCLLITFR